MNGAFLRLLSINSIKNFQSFQVFNQEIKLVSLVTHMCYQILINGKNIKKFHQGTDLLDTE